MAIPVSVLESYRPIDVEAADMLLSAEIEADDKKIIVLDDDPTGTQTVHDITVYTDWDMESIRDGFNSSDKVFYILTNSRGFTREETEKVHREIAHNLNEVSQETGIDFILVSRSDSTLRGHFPLETETLRAVLEKESSESSKRFDGEIICPYFKEGGRFTLGNIHYVKYGDELVPACETEFAQDKTFGYRSLTMPEYVEERTEGRYRAEDVTCITLDEIRSMDIDGIKAKLCEAEGFGKIIVNAIDDADLRVFCTAMYRAMKEGKNFIFRTAASIVKVMGGITDQPLLTREKMVGGSSVNGGVIVVGSHTAKTTAQVECLREIYGIDFVELDATLVRDEEAFEREVARCLAAEEASISAGRTVCCYTTRALITADTGNKEDELRLSVKISDAVQSLVGRLGVTPAFVIAKGGITSSDVAKKALGIRKALVLGQIRPGIPVWQAGEESKFPGVPYVVFPGNVGEKTTLREAAEILMAD